jgi:CheY-like chemotaxis protein
MKILVAEDDVSIAEGYKLILEHSGHQVTLTKDGSECLEVFMKHYSQSSEKRGSSSSPFDMIVLDYRMPKKDGIEVAREIRSVVPGQRILLATAYAHDVSIAKLHESAATKSVELIQKPFEFDQLLNIIESGQYTSTKMQKGSMPKQAEAANLSFVPSKDYSEIATTENPANGELSIHSDLQGIGFCP